MKRIDGQIWIDRKAPYRLKYHINGVDYIVQVAASYELGDDVEDIYAGEVVKFADKENAIEPAVFPDDINRVLGVALNSSHSDTPGGPDQVAVTNIGYLILEGEDLQSVFADPNDLDISKNGWNDENGGIGANVYWFIGRTRKDGDSFTYEDSIKHPGCLTVATPSGYKWNVTTVEDESLNVDYDNLPIIGSVTGYELSGNIVTKLNINVNFSAFDTSIEWVWPGYHGANINCGKVPKEDPVKNYLTIRHGLFPDSHSFVNASDEGDETIPLNNLRLTNYVKVLASDNPPITGSDYTIQTRIQNFYEDPDRKTIIDVFTPEDLSYRITGEVHYNFDEDHV